MNETKKFNFFNKTVKIFNLVYILYICRLSVLTFRNFNLTFVEFAKKSELKYHIHIKLRQKGGNFDLD